MRVPQRTNHDSFGDLLTLHHHQAKLSTYTQEISKFKTTKCADHIHCSSEDEPFRFERPNDFSSSAILRTEFTSLAHQLVGL